MDSVCSCDYKNIQDGGRLIRWVISKFDKDCPVHNYVYDPDPEYYGGPDYDLVRDMERGK